MNFIYLTSGIIGILSLAGAIICYNDIKLRLQLIILYLISNDIFVSLNNEKTYQKIKDKTEYKIEFINKNDSINLNK